VLWAQLRMWWRYAVSAHVSRLGPCHSVTGPRTINPAIIQLLGSSACDLFVLPAGSSSSSPTDATASFACCLGHTVAYYPAPHPLRCQPGGTCLPSAPGYAGAHPLVRDRHRPVPARPGGSFHPAALNYDRLTRVGMAARIRDFTFDKCQSFRADFHPLMPAYFKVGDRVYLKTRDYLGAGHVDRMVLHDSDSCTYLIVGYCYNRLEPSDRTCWFHITIHAAVALPRYMPSYLPRDHWYLTADRDMPQDNGTFYGMPLVCLLYHYSYYLDWFFARYTFQAPQGRSQAEPDEKHKSTASSCRSSQCSRREHKGE
jgi:hypothetical protein